MLWNNLKTLLSVKRSNSYISQSGKIRFFYYTFYDIASKSALTKNLGETNPADFGFSLTMLLVLYTEKRVD